MKKRMIMHRGSGTLAMNFDQIVFNFKTTLNSTL